MALWLDKHRPKKLNKLDFHKKQAEHLEKLVKAGDFPHLLVKMHFFTDKSFWVHFEIKLLRTLLRQSLVYFQAF